MIKVDRYQQVTPGDSWWRSTRLKIALVALVGFLHIYAQRVAFSVAIVCMVNHTAVNMLDDVQPATRIQNTTSTQVLYASDQRQCGHLKGGNDSSSTTDGPFVWDKTLQGHLLGSFFYGYMLSQIPAAILAEAYSGKWVMFAFTSLFTLTTLLVPVAAQAGWIYLLILRVIGGIGSGASFPTMLAIWRKWAPPGERTKLATIANGGACIGNIVTMPLAGLLCQYVSWQAIFYVIGSSSVLWLILWVFYVTDSPEKHRSVSLTEKEYIAKSLSSQKVSCKSRREERTPWLQMLTSRAVWAAIIAGISTDWCLYTFMTNMPTYIYEVLKFDIGANGLLSALPYIGFAINLYISAFVADKLISSGRMRIVTVRRLMMAVGSFGSAIFMVSLAYVDCSNPGLAVTFLVLGISGTASVYSGFGVNILEIAPQYAATIKAISNTMASVTGFAAPATVAALTQNHTAAEWKIVFFIAAGVYVLGATCFCVLSSGEVQSWAKIDQEKIYTNGQVTSMLSRTDENEYDVRTKIPSDQISV